VKRLLQKDPDARLPFSAFFSHPFLSGQPLRNLPALPDMPEVYVEEPTSSAIEDDYVILSTPSHLPQDVRPAAQASEGGQQSHSVSSGQTCTAVVALPCLVLATAAPGAQHSSGACDWRHASARCAGREDVQAQFQAHAGWGAQESDPILAAHAASLPSTLSHQQWLYVAAMCIAEVAGVIADFRASVNHESWCTEY
jgi:hypothetical protein